MEGRSERERGGGREEEGCTQRREWLLRGKGEGENKKRKRKKIRYEVLIRLE